jgi:ribonuclease D
VLAIRAAQQDDGFDDSTLDRLAQVSRERVKKALDFVRSTSAAAGLDPLVVATKRDIELVLAGCGGSRLLTGWRREFVGIQIQERLANEAV